MTPTEFIDMCKQLRALGAVTVAHGDMVAKFSPVSAAFVQQRQPPDEKPMTPEQAREAMRRRELGV